MVPSNNLPRFYLSFKNVVGTKITFSGQNVSDDAFSFPFSWTPEEEKKAGISGTWAQYSSLRHVLILCRAL